MESCANGKGVTQPALDNSQSTGSAGSAVGLQGKGLSGNTLSMGGPKMK